MSYFTTPLPPPRPPSHTYRRVNLFLKIAILIALLSILVGILSNRTSIIKETCSIGVETKCGNYILKDNRQNQSYGSIPQVDRIRKENFEENPSINNTEAMALNRKDHPNILFYKNAVRSGVRGFFIEDFQVKWQENYAVLEDQLLAGIQWIFPNFYQSKYNQDSHKLTKEEAYIFRTNFKLAEKLLKSYEAILGFYGLRMKDHLTGKIQREDNYKTRYDDTLFRYDNQLRIRRVLTHLNNVGFRKYAIELVNFLEEEIYGEIGAFEKFMRKDRSFNQKAFDNAPLRHLAGKKAFEEWKKYGDHKGDEKKIRILEENCFSKYPEEFEDSIIFTNYVTL